MPKLILVEILLYGMAVSEFLGKSFICRPIQLFCFINLSSSLIVLDADYSLRSQIL